jgi:hypothetical protein
MFSTKLNSSPAPNVFRSTWARMTEARSSGNVQLTHAEDLQAFASAGHEASSTSSMLAK